MMPPFEGALRAEDFGIRPIAEFAGLRDLSCSGERLAAVREAGRGFSERFRNPYQSSQMIASTVAPGIEPAFEQDELDFGDWKQ